MRHALALAERGLGNVYPNPAVGAVIVRDGNIAGRGWTAKGGRPHAETIAIAQAGDLAQNATLYVTLEPCSHHGKTSPCTQAIIAAGITHVVAACTDPNPKVCGNGFEQLRAAGVKVTGNICEAEAIKLNEGFFSVIKRQRPFVSLKLATSLDGKIATADGESQWLTCNDSRQYSHYLRKTHDAIITGIGTVTADNPSLTCRLPGCGNDSPQRIVIDSILRIPADANILPAWIFTSHEAFSANPSLVDTLIKTGSRVFTVPAADGQLPLPEILRQLAHEGITRLLVEAGSKLSSSFASQNLVDRIYWFRAPLVIGSNGLNALHGNNLPLSEIPRYSLRESRVISNDVLEVYDCG